MMRPTKTLLAPLLVVALLVSPGAFGQSVEGGNVTIRGNLVIGGMSFPGGSAEIRQRVEAAGYPCNTIRGFTVMGEGVTVYCNEERAAYRILPDADGEPIIAPVD